MLDGDMTSHHGMNQLSLSSPSEWQFYAKGNANAIYRYEGDEEQLRGKVLRLRLHKPSVNYASTEEIFAFARDKCEVHFPNNCIRSELVNLDVDFISRLGKDGFRLLTSEKFGILMDDILDGDYSTHELSKHCKLHVQHKCGLEAGRVASVILELKPKWLYDNCHNYCRNCSLGQQRNFDRHFCPLDLISKNTLIRGVDDLLSRVPSHIADFTSENCQFKLRSLLYNYLLEPENVFQKLKNLQRLEDDGDRICNIQRLEDISDALLFAMTMRDVGVFMKFEKLITEESDFVQLECMFRESDSTVLDDKEPYAVTISLYDFDLKLREKFEYWKKTDMTIREYYDSYNSKWPFCAKG